MEKNASNSLEPPADPTLRQPYLFLQDACFEHRFIRSRDTSSIVERPERLKALRIGFSAAISRLEEAAATRSPKAEDDLVRAMDQMSLSADADDTRVVQLVRTQVDNLADFTKHPAVQFVHGAEGTGTPYLEKLTAWATESENKIRAGESEIPQGFSQGDLYLCPGSLLAISGAIATVCEAVDTVTASQQPSIPSPPTNRLETHAFVAIRPPGHHCGEDTPSGFCFVNNVVIGAAHAHLAHGINRVVIFDIDLHHGNGTQSLVWTINEDTYRKEQELIAQIDAKPSGSPRVKAPPGLKIFYGSIHDVLSYPCEGGDAALIRDASVSLNGPHGQHIENIHLRPYETEEQFWNMLYPEYTRLLKRAEEFVKATACTPDGKHEDVMVFISCGFDASEHEYTSMSRHGRKVPTRFYYQFAKDACAFADKFAKGRVISVLEGGYSDRALISGGMAHLLGLANTAQPIDVLEEWWGVTNVAKLEKLTKKRRGGKQSLPSANSQAEKWLERATSLVLTLEPISPPAKIMTPAAPSAMTLRDRKKPRSSAPSPPVKPGPTKVTKPKKPAQSAGNSPVKMTFTESSVTPEKAVEYLGDENGKGREDASAKS